MDYLKYLKVDAFKVKIINNIYNKNCSIIYLFIIKLQIRYVMLYSQYGNFFIKLNLLLILEWSDLNKIAD